MGENNQWYTNKDLFESIGALKEDFSDLRGEMKETRIILQRYNGLSEDIARIREENASTMIILNDLVSKSSGKNAVLDGIRKWGGWVVAIITMFILIFNQIN